MSSTKLKCQVCTFENAPDTSNCIVCGQKLQTKSCQKCTKCTFDNESDNIVCAMCEQKLIWECTKCTFVNFSNSKNCEICKFEQSSPQNCNFKNDDESEFPVNINDFKEIIVNGNNNRCLYNALRLVVMFHKRKFDNEANLNGFVERDDTRISSLRKLLFLLYQDNTDFDHMIKKINNCGQYFTDASGENICTKYIGQITDKIIEQHDDSKIDEVAKEFKEKLRGLSNTFRDIKNPSKDLENSKKVINEICNYIDILIDGSFGITTPFHQFCQLNGINLVIIKQDSREKEGKIVTIETISDFEINFENCGKIWFLHHVNGNHFNVMIPKDDNVSKKYIDNLKKYK